MDHFECLERDLRRAISEGSLDQATALLQRFARDLAPGGETPPPALLARATSLLTWARAMLLIIRSQAAAQLQRLPAVGAYRTPNCQFRPGIDA